MQLSNRNISAAEVYGAKIRIPCTGESRDKSRDESSDKNPRRLYIEHSSDEYLCLMTFGGKGGCALSGTSNTDILKYKFTSVKLGIVATQELFLLSITRINSSLSRAAKIYNILHITLLYRLCRRRSQRDISPKSRQLTDLEELVIV